MRRQRRNALVVGLAAALSAVAAPGAGAARSTSGGFGGCSNVPTLTSTLPGQSFIPLQSQATMNCFAWQEFIALNWASAAQGCAADPAVPASAFGDPSSATPVVWETYASADDLYQPEAKTPGSWCPPGRARALKRLDDLNKFADTSNQVLREIAEASGRNTFLTAQNGNLTLFEVRVNHDEYAYVDQNGLYNLETQQTFAATQGINLPDGGPDSSQYGPDGALEVKAAWLELDDPAQWPRYLTSKARVKYPGQDAKTVTVGLVGLHIIRKLAGEQQLVWATFEQEDNAPDAGDRVAATTPHTYYDPTCNRQTDHYHCQTNVAPSSPVDPYSDPNQVTRTFGLQGNGVTALNADVQELITDESPASVFQHYELVNVLWPNMSTKIPPGQKVPLPADMQPDGGSDPVSNTTLETYVQFKTCTDCHREAPVAGSSTIASDYSFLFSRAQAPKASVGAVAWPIGAGAGLVLLAAAGVVVRRRRRTGEEAA